MKRSMLPLMLTLALLSEGFTQTKANPMDTDRNVAVDENKFNPMSQAGSRRISEEARSNLEKKYNCIIASVVSGVSWPIIPWKAGGDKGYIEIVDETLIHRYSSDGRLVAVEPAEKLFQEQQTEEKRLCKMYLERFGMTEDEAKTAAREEDERRLAQRVEERQKQLEKHMAARRVDEKGGERPARLGGLARLRQRRMEMEAKQRREQEQLKKAQEERENERKKFFPPLMPFADAAKKAKDGDGAALYAVALHYAKGEEIVQDLEKARIYLNKAVDANYPAAVLVDAIARERAIDGIRFSDFPRIDPETGLNSFESIFYPFTAKKWTPLKDTENVEHVRNGYKKAAALGLSMATNELARFERRIAEAQKAAEIKAKNETLAKELQ